MNIENPQAKTEKRDSFEKQFSNKEIIKVLDGEVEVVDIVPEKLEKETPILFAPGWGCTPQSYKDAIRVMSERGRRVLAIEHDRTGISGKAIKNRITEEIKDEAIEELRKTFSILAVLEAKKIEKADVIAHSEGAINVVMAATEKPENFGTIIFLNPAGMIGKDNFFKLSSRFTLSEIKDIFRSLAGTQEEKDRFKNHSKELFDYIKSNILRANKETLAISRSDIQDRLKNLKQNGIRVIVVAGVDDPLFPMDKMQKSTDSQNLDGFISVKGGHIEIATRPEKLSPAIESLLSEIEDKRDEKI